MPDRCPTCGGAVEVFTADEGTSHYRPVDRRALARERVGEPMKPVEDLPPGCTGKDTCLCVSCSADDEQEPG